MEKNHWLILYRAMKKIQQKTETNPLSVLRQAIRGVTPDSKGKTCRRRNTFPIEIGTRKSTCHSLVIRGIPKTSGSKYGFQIQFRIRLRSGDAIRKKEETHRMAEANRAFAHFR